MRNDQIKRLNRVAIVASFAAASAVAFAQTASGPLALRTDPVPMADAVRAADPSPERTEQLTLRQAVDLALEHSTGVKIAQYDQKKAEHGLAEARYAFLPQITVGSGLGYSDGFPLSLENLAPSLININSSAYVVNLAQKEFIKAGRHELAAMTKLSEDRRAQVVYDVALTYAQLDSVESARGNLRQQQQSATRVQTVAQQRTQAGVDSPVELTKAKLALARVRLDMEESQGQIELLRAHLAQLTGLQASQIQTVSDSIPSLPVPVDAREYLPKVVASSANVAMASESAAAKEAQAKGEHRQMWPQVDYALQYAALARYNNYDVYFRSSAFQRNNITAGVVVRWSLFNAPQMQRAQIADYEALKARKQAEDVKNQVTNEAMKLQQSVRQLAAARDVAQLEYQLATTDVLTVQARLDAGGATIRDHENARLAEHQKLVSYMDANFSLEKALMQLLVSTGEIESWAKSGK